MKRSFVPLSRWSVALSATLLALSLSGCGGGGGGDDVTPPPEPYPVSIASPTDSPSYETDDASLAMLGSAFVPEGASCQCVGLDCLFGHGTLPDGYRVTWTNATTGQSGSAWQYYLNCLLQVRVIWDAIVPLAPGSNVIRINATDSGGNTGMATLTVTRLTDATAPQVVGISPADGASNVDVNSKVMVTFNEAMDEASVNASNLVLVDRFSNVVPASVAAGPYTNTWTLTPAAPMAYDSSYHFTVTSEVRDLAGNPLAATPTISFTTAPAPDATPPAVVAVSPPAGSSCAGSNRAVTITLSEDVVASTLFFGLTGPGGLPVAGGVSHQGGTLVWSFNAFDGLAPGVSYQATVAAGLKDYSNNVMNADYNWNFSTSTDGVERCN